MSRFQCVLSAYHFCLEMNAWWLHKGSSEARKHKEGLNVITIQSLVKNTL
jgi:hypothetical protein